ncbi:MAG: SDR family NAD(P)-dependent oxidoreductase, partial [Arenicellales bacterium]|nr:SDR family NAD(P)-dependent oxidoreductase [Arenicellales bacterium]
MDVTGKIAIVTGGGRGIGRGIVLALAGNGADVVVADIVEDDAKDLAGEIEAMGRRALACVVDVTDQASVDRMVDGTIDRFGRIDILVNNAGIIAAPGWEQRETSSEEDWDRIYDVNVKGMARATNAVAARMRENRYGKIINISSVAGRQGNPFNTPYGIS